LNHNFTSKVNSRHCRVITPQTKGSNGKRSKHSKYPYSYYDESAHSSQALPSKHNDKVTNDEEVKEVIEASQIVQQPQRLDK